ncbi:MAG: endonuclease/exonuclease/phosphatase family protein [Spirochaetales bacterium]|nr:endonuclease/exonuclease/phosphatase family protein [Spirochaetales bacterium]
MNRKLLTIIIFILTVISSCSANSSTDFSVSISIPEGVLTSGSSSTFNAVCSNVPDGSSPVYTWCVDNVSMKRESLGSYIYTPEESGTFTIGVMADCGNITDWDEVIVEVETSSWSQTVSEADDSTDDESEDTENSLRIACWNMEDFSISGSYTAAAEFVSSEEVDVIVMEETQSDDEAGLESALKIEGITMPYTSYCAANSGEDGFLIFSKYEIENTGKVAYSSAVDPVSGDTMSFAYHRPVYCFEIVFNEHEVVFYVCHLDSGTAETDQKRRRAQSSALRQYILSNDDTSSGYIVILGDMNTMGDGINRDGGLIGPSDFTDNELDFDIKGSTVDTIGTLGHLLMKADSDSINDFISINYSLLPKKRTQQYKTSTYLSLLDHIIVSPSLYEKCIASSLKIKTDWSSYSDHYPVVCSFEF